MISYPKIGAEPQGSDMIRKLINTLKFSNEIFEEMIEKLSPGNSELKDEAENWRTSIADIEKDPGDF